MKRPRSTNRLLLVEGDSDRQVVLQIMLMEKSGYDPSEIEVFNAKGLGNLVKSIRGRLSASEFDSNESDSAVGIIVDADRDIHLIWNRITDELRTSGVDVSRSSDPPPKGAIFERQRPRLKVGVWIMPNNESAGELEDFLSCMVPSKNADWPRARRYVKCSEGKFGQKVTRAEVLSWIATRETPGRFDEAIRNGDLRIDGELCQRFIAWLDRLFAVEEAAAEPA